MRSLFTATIILSATARAEIHEVVSVQRNWNPCASVYFESPYLNSASTVAGLIVPKAGYCARDLGLEFFGTARTGMDTETFLEKSDAIYNDNFLFLGVGVDYTKLFPGVRLTAQVGNSFDLNPKIHLGGFDVRTGWMTYHEIEWLPSRFRNEIYSEGFYIRRYKDVIGDLQVRSFFTLWNSAPLNRYRGFEVGPYVNLTASYDSVGYDYNRFEEAQFGGRVRYQAPLTLAFHVLGVEGHRMEGAISNYSDFRLLLTGYWEM